MESSWFVWVSQMNHIPMHIDYDKNLDWVSTQVRSLLATIWRYYQQYLAISAAITDSEPSEPNNLCCLLTAASSLHIATTYPKQLLGCAAAMVLSTAPGLCSYPQTQLKALDCALNY